MVEQLSFKSALFIPANQPRFIEKAHTRGAQAIILDLEDSVPNSKKEEARNLIENSSKLLKQQGLRVLVRINRNWSLAVKDIEVAVSSSVDGLLLPKVDSASQVTIIDEIVSDFENRQGDNSRRTQLIAFIETVEGLNNAMDIAASSKRLQGISLGSEDFSARLGVEPTRENLIRPCQEIVYAAVNAGINPLGFCGSIAEFSDLDKLTSIVLESRQMGFVGACCIHPNQVKVLNEAFSPTEREIDKARTIIEIYQRSKGEGIGAISVDGSMVDEPVYLRALRVLSLI